ncbi:MAG: DUF2917 domain-containing protein [Burkholderiaceae bacterium]
MRHEPAVFKTLDLPGGTLVPFPSVPGERVRILHGRVWLTEEGYVGDAFLGSGEEVSLHSRGLAVIEALAPARIEWIKPVRGGWSVAAWCNRIIAAAREWLNVRRQPVGCG